MVLRAGEPRHHHDTNGALGFLERGALGMIGNPIPDEKMALRPSYRFAGC